jgi:hypothetical protein
LMQEQQTKKKYWKLFTVTWCKHMFVHTKFTV